MSQGSLMPLEDALASLLAMADAQRLPQSETLAVDEARQRVLATDLVATLDLPPWPNSAMDGYALNLRHWDGQPLPVSQTIFAGQPGDPCSRAAVRGSSPARRCRPAPIAWRCRRTSSGWRTAGCASPRR